MKINFKKTVSLLTALALCFAFAGCNNSSTTSTESWIEEDVVIKGSTTQSSGSKNSTDGNQSAQTNNNGKALSWNEIKAQMPSALRGTTVTLWDWNNVSDRPGASDVIDKFTKETGIKVNFVRQSGGTDEYATKVTAAVASNKAPDIVRLRGYEMGLINSLQPVENIKFDFNDKAWDSRVLNYYSFGGKRYAVNLQDTLYQQPYMLIYNKNLIGKYDLEDPYTLWKQGKWTITKFEEILKTFKEEARNDYTAWTSYQFEDVANWYGQSLVMRNGDKFVNNTSNKNLVKGLQTYSNWVEKGYVTSVRFDRTNFENGKILFFTESPIGLRRTHYYFAELKKAGSLSAVPNPTVDGGLSKDTTMISEFEAYGFPKGAPNAVGAAYFLRYFLDANNYDKNTFFTDKTVLDVYETLMKNSKVFKNSDYYLITADNGTRGEAMAEKLAAARSNQIVTTLDGFSPVVNNNVKSVNSIVGHLGK